MNINPKMDVPPAESKDIKVKLFEEKKEILTNKIKEYYSKNFSDPGFGWNFPDEFCKFYQDTINLIDSKDFIYSLEILKRVETLYTDYYQELQDFEYLNEQERRPIGKLVDSLEEKSREENANLLLSSYIDKIKNSPSYLSYSQIPVYLIEDIGGGIFADVSLSSYDNEFTISNPKDYQKIKSLLQEREDLKKKEDDLKKSFFKKSKYDLSAGHLMINSAGKAVYKPDYFSKGVILSDEKQDKAKEYIETEDAIKFINDDLENLFKNNLDLSAMSTGNQKDVNFKIKDDVFRMLWSNKNFRKTLEKNLGINFKDYNLPEQFQIIEFLKTLKNNQAENIKNFSTKFGYFGFRTFLSIEQGGKEMGDKILALGEKLPEEVAKKLFAKYSEMIDEVDKMVILIKEKLNTEKDINVEDEQNIKDNFLKRAKNLLEKYVDLEDKPVEEIINELENLKIENVSILSIFQSLHNTKNLKFEEIKDFEFYNEYTSPEYVTEDEYAEMEDIIKKNYKNAPPEIRNKLLGILGNIIENAYADSVDIPRLNYKGKIVAFCRIEYEAYFGNNKRDYWNKKNSKAYFGSFNIDPDFANGEIGQAMFERTIEDIVKTHPIELDCNAESYIGSKYIEMGFIGIDYYDFYGWPSFKAIRDDTLNKNYLGKNLSIKEIVDNKDKGYIEKEGRKVEIFSATNQKDFAPILKSISTNEKILTRYFKFNNEWFVVLEPSPFSTLEKNTREKERVSKLETMSRDEIYEEYKNKTDSNILVMVGKKEDGEDYSSMREKCPKGYSLKRLSFDIHRNIWLAGFEKENLIS